MWTHHISRDEGMINSEIVHCEEMIKSAKLHMQSIFRCKILFSKDIYIWMHDLWCDILTKHWLQRKNILRNISETTGATLTHGNCQRCGWCLCQQIRILICDPSEPTRVMWPVYDASQRAENIAGGARPPGQWSGQGWWGHIVTSDQCNEAPWGLSWSPGPGTDSWSKISRPGAITTRLIRMQ